MTKIIGLTGGIGSGKTTVAKFFLNENIPVYFADDQAKTILNLSETIKELVLVFGDDIIVNKTVDRKKLSNIVFNNPEKLKQLNQIIHPKVAQHFKNWLNNHNKEAFIVKEAAILIESGSYKYCDKIICVTANLKTRIKRVVERDKVSENEVLQRINNQLPEEERLKYAQFVIKNEDLAKTKLQFDKILKKLKNL